MRGSENGLKWYSSKNFYFLVLLFLENSLTPVIILQSSFKALHGKNTDASQWEY